MRPQEMQERKIKRVLYAGIFCVIGMYLSQIAFIHLRLHLINAEMEELVIQSDSCDATNCSAQWLIKPKHRLLLLGHIMRTHQLLKEDTKEQIFPVSRVRGITADSWSGIRVYAVDAGATYRLKATKPTNVKMGYFVGILPRSTDHEGVLSVPDISPTVSSITTMAGFGILGVLLFAAFLAPRSRANGTSSRDELTAVAFSAVAAVMVSAIGSGIVDSLLPDGELRSKLLRTAVLLSVGIILLQRLLAFSKLRIKTRIFISIVVVSSLIHIYWASVRAGNNWIALLAISISIFSIYLFRRNYKAAGLLSIIGLYDPITMNGIRLNDSPPIFLMHVCIIGAFCLVVSKLGAISVITLASRAYQRFTRDISLARISEHLSQNVHNTSTELPAALRNTLPLISQLTGARRVSVLINLPFARPITHSYDATDQNTTTYDDGRIPGAVTVRAFVFGDEAWFEKYSDFSKRLGISTSSHLDSADYICVSPIRVNQNNMGVLMLTCFNDENIAKSIKNGSIDDDRETGRMLVDTLASSFSEVIIGNLKESSHQSSDLLSKVREAIPASSTSDEFLQRFCQAVHDVTNLRTMLHEWRLDQAVPISQAGFEPDHWSEFANAPFNLKESAARSYGSTVVAFREQKSSYMKDWREIQDKLHPKTVQIMETIHARSFLAVPLSSGETRYVITLISHTNESAKDPGIMSIIESTEAIFDAAVTVLNQRTSVLALGKLANRLIGDDDVRDKIIAAAKEEHLPTTIGTPRTSFLLLFDLAGSSDLPADTEEKARSYGLFYDEVNKVVQSRLGGKIRKTIGDAIIATWDGTHTNLEEVNDLVSNLVKSVKRADQVAKDVGCLGIRAVLHHGDYFFGLIGTSSFGQIDVIGRGIDEVCKIEGSMKGTLISGQKIKIAISHAASLKLKNIGHEEWTRNGFLLASDDSRIDQRGNELLWTCCNLDIAPEISIDKSDNSITGSSLLLVNAS